MSPAHPSRRAVLAGGLALLAAPALGAEPFTIPVIVSLTGPSSFLGQGTRQSLQALEDYVNRTGGIRGRPVEFVYSDDQTNPQVAVQLLNPLIQAKAPVVMGSINVGVCNAMAALCKDGPVLYCLSPGVHPDKGSFEFSALTSTTDAIAVALRYFHDTSLRRIAIITSTDATGQDADRILDAAIASYHGELVVVDREHFNPQDLSVAAQMAKIKSANPEVLVAWSTGSPAATVLRSFKDAALDIPVLTSYGNSVNSVMQQWASFLPSSLFISAQANLAPQQVTDRGVKAALDAHFAELARRGLPHDVLSGGAWDAGLLVVDAFRRLGTGATASQVRDFLANTRDWPGICGRYDFVALPQRGIGADVMYVARWDAPRQSWIAVSRAGGVPLR